MHVFFQFYIELIHVRIGIVHIKFTVALFIIQSLLRHNFDSHKIDHAKNKNHPKSDSQHAYKNTVELEIPQHAYYEVFAKELFHQNILPPCSTLGSPQKAHDFKIDILHRKKCKRSLNLLFRFITQKTKFIIVSEVSLSFAFILFKP